MTGLPESGAGPRIAGLAPELTPFAVTQPGVYNIPADIYHADPVPGGSLSSTGARKLLPPDGCPAKYRYWTTHPEPPKKHFDLGTAAHHLVLGIGARPVELDFMDMRSNAAKDAAYDIRAAGDIPLLPDQMATVQDMAAAIHDHPAATALFAPGTGQPERALFWRQDGIWRRALLDWLSGQRLKDGRLIIPDYKTAKSAQPREFMRSVISYGYHQQAAWYMDAVRGAGVLDKDEDRDPAFLFVVQEKTPPFVVSVIELPPEAIMWGRELNAEAVKIYRECRKSGRWPGYSDAIEMPSFPAWADYMYEEIVT
jgi:hypothetical protein